MKLTTKHILWILIILLIVIPSLLDLSAVITVHWIDQDKYAHLSIFALFMVVTQLLFSKLSLLKIAGLSFLLGLAIEVLQEFLTHGTRHFDANDILYNVLGVLLGGLLLVIYKHKKE